VKLVKLLNSEQNAEVCDATKAKYIY